jgi:hypothetical protein
MDDQKVTRNLLRKLSLSDGIASSMEGNIIELWTNRWTAFESEERIHGCGVNSVWSHMVKAHCLLFRTISLF